VLAVAVVLTVPAAWRTYVGERGARPTPSVTIAVLPFACYSTDAADQMLAARLTDGVTSELARIGALGVVSRTSALRFEGVRRPLKEVAQALDADIVVEASVQTEGDHLRIQTRLVDAVVDRKGWIQDFDGRRADVPTLQRRIAEAITAAAQMQGAH
jgi:TolB-like protein